MDERYDAEALRFARQAAMAGETVLWAGRPGRRWIPGLEVVQLLFALGVIAVIFGGRMMEDPGSIRHWWQWFVPWVLAAPFLIALGVAGWVMWRRDREIYAVTDWRVLILASNGVVRHAVGLERAGAFRRVGRTLRLGGEDEAVEEGKGDLDGGMARFEQLPKLERLTDAEQVLATIRRAAARAAA